MDLRFNNSNRSCNCFAWLVIPLLFDSPGVTETCPHLLLPGIESTVSLSPLLTGAITVDTAWNLTDNGNRNRGTLLTAE